MSKNSNLAKARDFVFKGMLCLDSLQQLEHTGVYLRESQKSFGKSLSGLTFAEFSAQIVDDATKMSKLYIAFFCFENSIS